MVCDNDVEGVISKSRVRASLKPDNSDPVEMSAGEYVTKWYKAAAAFGKTFKGTGGWYDSEAYHTTDESVLCFAAVEEAKIKGMNYDGDFTGVYDRGQFNQEESNDPFGCLIDSDSILDEYIEGILLRDKQHKQLCDAISSIGTAIAYAGDRIAQSTFDGLMQVACATAGIDTPQLNAVAEQMEGFEQGKQDAIQNIGSTYGGDAVDYEHFASMKLTDTTQMSPLLMTTDAKGKAVPKYKTKTRYGLHAALGDGKV